MGRMRRGRQKKQNPKKSLDKLSDFGIFKELTYDHKKIETLVNQLAAFDL